MAFASLSPPVMGDLLHQPPPASTSLHQRNHVLIYAQVEANTLDFTHQVGESTQKQ
jgi:hypothetical protein